MPEVTILRLPEVLAAVKLSKSTVYAMMTRGEFPAPVRLSVRARGWRADDISAWLEGRSTGTAA